MIKFQFALCGYVLIYSWRSFTRLLLRSYSRDSLEIKSASQSNSLLLVERVDSQCIDDFTSGSRVTVFEIFTRVEG